MTTLFKAPQIGEPRSTGIKNGGVTSYDTRIVHPVTRIVGDSFESGKQIEFRWRSSSSAYHNPRETKLGVRYRIKFGNAIGDGAGALSGEEVPSNVRMTACANSCLFADGCQYQVNSTMVENQPNYYQAAMVQLYTKYDSQADTSGSCGLITRRKDFHAPTRDFEYPDPTGDTTRIATSDLAELYNPKQEVLRQAFTDKDSTTSGEFELLDNIWLSSWQHGYFVAGSDHNLTFTIGQNFAQDLFHSIDFRYKTLTKADGPPVTYTPQVNLTEAYTNLVCGLLPADGACASGTVYVEIVDVALHCAMAGSVPSIPPSVALKYSELQITKRALTQMQQEESIVVPPSTRAIYVFSNQNVHDIRADAEELGLAGAGIDELGLTLPQGAGNPATQPHTITNLLCELGGQLQPSNGGYNNMDVTQLKAGRPFTDALSVVGKPSSMRGTTWDFLDWCGKKSVNGRQFPAAATGVRGSPSNDVAGEIFGDQGPGFLMRMILPPNSLSNVLTVRCTLDAAPAVTANQQLLVVCVHDSLWTMQYAAPAELPIETKVAPIT